MTPSYDWRSTVDTLPRADGRDPFCVTVDLWLLVFLWQRISELTQERDDLRGRVNHYAYMEQRREEKANG